MLGPAAVLGPGAGVLGLVQGGEQGGGAGLHLQGEVYRVLNSGTKE